MSKSKRVSIETQLSAPFSVTLGSENVFEDLGFSKPVAKSHMYRSQLMIEICKEIRKRGWTQKETAKALGIAQPRVSDLVTGQLDKFSVDSLLDYLHVLGKSVTIGIDESKSDSLSEGKCNELLKEGMDNLEKGQKIKAVKSFEQAMRYAEKLGMPEVLGDCYYLFAGALGCANKIAQSVEYFKKAAKVYSELDDQRKHHLTLKSLGRTYLNQSQFQEAGKVLEQALKIAEQLPVGSVDAVDILILLGAIYDEQKNYTRSERLARRLLELDVQKYGKNSPKLVPIYKLILSLLRKQKKVNDVKQIEAAIKILQSSRHVRAIESFQIQSSPAFDQAWRSLPNYEKAVGS